MTTRFVCKSERLRALNLDNSVSRRTRRYSERPTLVEGKLATAKSRTCDSRGDFKKMRNRGSECECKQVEAFKADHIRSPHRSRRLARRSLSLAPITANRLASTRLAVLVTITPLQSSLVQQHHSPGKQAIHTRKSLLILTKMVYQLSYI